MMDYRTCANCGAYCPYQAVTEDCKHWKPIQCPFCGGTLSEIREQGGKRLRHCYACHFEFEVKDD